MSEPDEQTISITLSAAQVEAVLRAATRSTAPGIAALISGTLRRRAQAEADGAEANGARSKPDGVRAPHVPRSTANGAIGADRRLSRSLLRGLSIVTCFSAAGEERGIVDLAREAGMSASTAHRYALTLVELGLLERSPRSRKYRLPETPSR
jgi:IclR helix-turn-helix domain